MTSENDRDGAPAPVEPTVREPSAPAAAPSAAGSGEAVAPNAGAGTGAGESAADGGTDQPAAAPADAAVPAPPAAPPSAATAPAPPPPAPAPPPPGGPAPAAATMADTAAAPPPAAPPAPAGDPDPSGTTAHGVPPAQGTPPGLGTPHAPGAGDGSAAGPASGAPAAAPGAPHAAAGQPGGAAGGGDNALGSWSAFPVPPPPPRRRRGGLVAAIVAVTVLAGGLGGYGGYLLADSGGSPGSAASSGGNGDLPERSPESVAGIADEALPSVVTLQAAEGREGGTGTGFVYDEEGHIVTNNHVVAEAAQGGTVTATFSDGESFDAEVVGGAQGYDIAVLKLKDVGDRDLTPLPLGDSDEVAVGDATVAIGAPFGLSGTVTTGIISALDRPVASSDGMGGAASYMSALQTDASINPGNSGGPLLDATGAVIGVNSAIQSNSAAPGQQAGSVGLGFAIPVNQAQRVAQDLIDDGEPVYAVIGVTVDMTENTTAGAQVVDEGEGGAPAVPSGGPAAEAGLEPGDVITRFGDRVIDSGPTLISEIWTYEPGETVELTYERNGTEHTASLTLDSRVGDQD